MLSILRTLLMVRTAYIVLLLTAFMVSTAGAARITPAQTRAHASIGKNSLRRTHRPVHVAPKRSSRYSKSRAAHRSYGQKPSLRARHAKVNRYHPAARFTQISTTTTRPAQSRPAQIIPEPSIANPPSSEATSSEQVSNPPEVPAAASATTEASAPETPTNSNPATDLSPPGDISSPLNASVEAEHPIVSSAGPLASLHRPRMFASPLRGSHDSLVRQNERSEADYLERIEDDADLADRISRGMLVPVPESAALAVNANLPLDRRYCRPWTASFLTDLARSHRAQFHTPIMVSSAVRTVEYQKRLIGINGNAAAAEGDIVSPHVTGATIDIAKSGLSRREITWMRNQLLPLQTAGMIDVEEEFRQACFHITVYKNYISAAPSHKSRRASAQTASGADTQLGAEAIASKVR